MTEKVAILSEERIAYLESLVGQAKAAAEAFTKHG